MSLAELRSKALAAADAQQSEVILAVGRQLISRPCDLGEVMLKLDVIDKKIFHLSGLQDKWYMDIDVTIPVTLPNPSVIFLNNAMFERIREHLEHEHQKLLWLLHTAKQQGQKPCANCDGCRLFVESRHKCKVFISPPGCNPPAHIFIFDNPREQQFLEYLNRIS